MPLSVTASIDIFTQLEMPAPFAAAFSLRPGGTSKAPYDSLNMALHVGDDPRRVRDNRQQLFSALGWPLERAVVAQQIHGTAAVVVDESDAGRGTFSHGDAISGADALITRTPNLPLVCFSADCVLLALADPAAKILAVLHAGWRGMAEGIIENTIQQMCDIGAAPERLHVASGAFIQPCCFEVGNEVVAALGKVHALERDGRTFLDLASVSEWRLERCGVRRENVRFDARCSCCESELFFSHRRTTKSSGKHTGRMALVAMIA